MNDHGGHDDRVIRETVKQLASEDLTNRVRSKVREKWGPVQKNHDLPAADEIPVEAIPRVTGVQVVRSPSGEDTAGIPDIAPSNVLLDITREARVSGNFQSWVMLLGINGFEVKVTYAVSDLQLAQAHSAQMGEHILLQMINEGARAVAELLRKGIAEDLLQMVKADTEKVKLFPFLVSEKA